MHAWVAKKVAFVRELPLHSMMGLDFFTWFCMRIIVVRFPLGAWLFTPFHVCRNSPSKRLASLREQRKPCVLTMWYINSKYDQGKSSNITQDTLNKIVK